MKDQTSPQAVGTNLESPCGSTRSRTTAVGAASTVVSWMEWCMGGLSVSFQPRGKKANQSSAPCRSSSLFWKWLIKEDVVKLSLIYVQTIQKPCKVVMTHKTCNACNGRLVGVEIHRERKEW